MTTQLEEIIKEGTLLNEAQDYPTKTQKLNQNHCEGVGRGGLEAGRLHPVPRINTSRIPPFCRRFDFISCSVRALVMPHSATSIARGDEISTTISWNSGV